MIQEGPPQVDSFFIGCPEENFWDNGPFYRHLASFPGFGIETTADTVGTVLGIGTAVGIGAHAVATNVRKRKIIKQEMEHSVKDEELTSAKEQEGGE